jgi:hypothetical protein
MPNWSRRYKQSGLCQIQAGDVTERCIFVSENILLTDMEFRNILIVISKCVFILISVSRASLIFLCRALEEEV